MYLAWALITPMENINQTQNNEILFSFVCGRFVSGKTESKNGIKAEHNLQQVLFSLVQTSHTGNSEARTQAFV